MTRKIALSLKYCGSGYHGWQIQENARTVGGVLSDAVSSLFSGNCTKPVGCGRTDTGVHANFYIASFETDSTLPTERIVRALNALLPQDISVTGAFEVDSSFHPIHTCERKEYSYLIHNSKTRNPFYENRILHFPYDFDFEAVKEASSHFVGTHDFASMRSLGTELKTTVRTVFDCSVTKREDIIKVTISADGFLYNMARTIVGTLLDVASGKLSPEEIEGILLSCDRSRAGATAPAHGLYMTNVIYPEKFGLPKAEEFFK